MDNDNVQPVSMDERFAQIEAAYNARTSSGVNELGAEGSTMAPYRNIFGAYPCYRANIGPHGMPHRVTDMGVVNTLAEIKRAHAENQMQSIRIAPISFEGIMPGYRPRTHLYLVSAHYTDPTLPAVEDMDDYAEGDVDTSSLHPIAGMTIMHVVEKQSEGAPVDADYLYIWRGGMEFYADPEMRAELEGVISQPREITLNKPFPAHAPRVEQQGDMPASDSFIESEPEV